MPKPKPPPDPQVALDSEDAVAQYARLKAALAKQTAAQDLVVACKAALANARRRAQEAGWEVSHLCRVIEGRLRPPTNNKETDA